MVFLFSVILTIKHQAIWYIDMFAVVVTNTSVWIGCVKLLKNNLWWIDVSSREIFRRFCIYVPLRLSSQIWSIQENNLEIRIFFVSRFHRLFRMWRYWILFTHDSCSQLYAIERSIWSHFVFQIIVCLYLFVTFWIIRFNLNHFTKISVIIFHGKFQIKIIYIFQSFNFLNK